MNHWYVEFSVGLYLLVIPYSQPIVGTMSISENSTEILAIKQSIVVLQAYRAAIVSYCTKYNCTLSTFSNFRDHDMYVMDGFDNIQYLLSQSHPDFLRIAISM